MHGPNARMVLARSRQLAHAWLWVSAARAAAAAARSETERTSR